MAFRRVRLSFPLPGRQAGLTLIDLLVVVVIVSILAAYGVMKMNSKGDDTLWYQAQRLARDIRHAQVLSSTWGRPLKIVSTASGSVYTYRVECVTPGSSPCNASAGTAITDPATGNAFSVTLQYGVTLSPATTVYFDIQGRPVNSDGVTINYTAPITTYSVTSSGTSVTLALAPVTGFLTVSN
jgi:prepilin-type N-terminal cleavage/methylation domain-containing protein